MRVSDQAAGALLGLAAIFLVGGLVVMSPAGTFAAAAVAGLLALAPLLFGSTKRRIVAGVILGVALVMGIPAYLDHQRMVERAKQYQRDNPGEHR